MNKEILNYYFWIINHSYTQICKCTSHIYFNSFLIHNDYNLTILTIFFFIIREIKIKLNRNGEMEYQVIIKQENKKKEIYSKGTYSIEARKMLFLNEKLALRTNENYYEDAINGTLDEPSNGVKWLTFLGDHLKFPSNDLIDYMHLIFEGVCRILFESGLIVKIKTSRFT